MNAAEAAIAAAEEILAGAKATEVVEGLRDLAQKLLQLADNIEAGGD